jgi:hypothetical protein
VCLRRQASQTKLHTSIRTLCEMRMTEMRITLIEDRGPPSRTSYMCFGPRIVCVQGIQQYSVRELRLVITLCVSAQTRMHIREEHISSSNQSDFQMTRNV